MTDKKGSVLLMVSRYIDTMRSLEDGPLQWTMTTYQDGSEDCYAIAVIDGESVEIHLHQLATLSSI